jgi:hypothetical protein
MNITARITTLSVAAATLASVQAMDTSLQGGGLVLGGDGKAPVWSVVASADLANKAMDQGWVLSDDATLRLKAGARFYGFGLTAFGQVAVGEDRNASYRANGNPRVEPQNPAQAYAAYIQEAQQRWVAQFSGVPYINAKYVSRKVMPGELVDLNLKVDYLLQINGVYPDGGPFLQLIPHFEWNTYPYQPSNDLKKDQRWLGADMWWATPLAGVEIGANSDWNVAMPGYRGAAAMREFYQAAPFDLAFWQVVNWGSTSYHNYWAGSDHRGLTYGNLGARATVPLAWVDWWVYGQADWTYWLSSEDRDRMSLLNRDAGDLQFAIGIEFRP